MLDVNFFNFLTIHWLFFWFFHRYRWTKNGQPFDYEAEEGRISRQAHKGTLYVNKPLDSDEGVYQCFAENIHGVSLSNTVSLRKSGMEFHFIVFYIKLINGNKNAKDFGNDQNEFWKYYLLITLEKTLQIQV